MKDNHVGPHDVAARLREEFPGAEVIISDVQGLDATIEVKADKPRPVMRRAKELAAKAALFNMHMDVGHRSRKTNWWKV
jgi:hypothetical protein